MTRKAAAPTHTVTLPRAEALTLSMALNDAVQQAWHRPEGQRNPLGKRVLNAAYKACDTAFAAQRRSRKAATELTFTFTPEQLEALRVFMTHRVALAEADTYAIPALTDQRKNVLAALLAA